MKKNDVKVGETYRVKVGGSVADVRITAENSHGGWNGVNVATNRKIRIKSPQRLRGKSPARPGGKRVKVPTGAKKATKATKDAKPATKRDTGERDAKGAKRPSGLDAAAQVLAEAGEPLNTKAMVDRMLAQGLWQTNGKTPAATIYAAILREINTKGDAARFRKVERGKFALASRKGA